MCPQDPMHTVYEGLGTSTPRGSARLNPARGPIQRTPQPSTPRIGPPSAFRRAATRTHASQQMKGERRRGERRRGGAGDTLLLSFKG